MDDIALIIRELSNPSSNIDDFTIYRGLMSIIEYYNSLARRKRVPTKKIPVYNNRMNHALLKHLINNILRDIDRIKDIKEIKSDVLTGVTFEGNVFKNGIWIYTIIDSTNNVGVKLNPDRFSEIFTGSSVTLDYDHMPYERLIDTVKNEYTTTSYHELFGDVVGEKSLLPDTVTSLTINNWTNINVTNMSCMFVYCGSLTSLTLGDNFNTANVIDMSVIFGECVSLTSLTLGNSFNTSKAKLIASFNNNTTLESISLYRSAESIIKWLNSSPNWNVMNDTLNTIGKLYIVGSDPVTVIWDPSTLPNTWSDEQWTLART